MEPYKAPYSATVKSYGGRKKKLTVCKNKVKQSGLNGAFDNTRVDTSGNAPPPAETGLAPPNTQGDNKSSPSEAEKERFACNLSRARSTIYELALCNDWNYFFTFTLDPQKYDRSNLNVFRKDLSRFFRKYREKYNVGNLKYLLVPELHKDGINWHMHGFLMGLPEEHLKPFTMQEHLPYYILYKLEKNELVYDWEAYRNKFGFCNIEPIKDLEASAIYITKYLFKSMDSSTIQANGHLYYASQGLNRAKITARGFYDPQQILDFDFENEYVLLKWYGENEQPETFVHTDEKIHILREKRNKQFPTINSRKGTDFEPQWNPETGEIYKNPFDDQESFTVFD